ncbi:aTPase [Clostridium sp. CAG:813]|nr:aTPase [Clostridium sp. CAG:813]
MLKKIICDKFIENEIVFHNGLNVVLGDDIASNSIGKTTLLMIIDFIFGGNDYINKNKDVIENLGHHTFNFIFQFGDELLYFSRNTENPKEITMCDKYFNLIKKISITEYTNRLKQYYKCKIDDFSFRDIIGRFFRIYGKENLNEKKPIQYYEKETFSESIINLIKLFKLYPTIKNLEEQINDIKNKKKFIEEAVKRNFVPNVTKSIFNTNKDKIDKLNSELSDLKKSIISSSVSIENIITQEVIILKQQKIIY